MEILIGIILLIVTMFIFITTRNEQKKQSNISVTENKMYFQRQRDNIKSIQHNIKMKYLADKKLNFKGDKK